MKLPSKKRLKKPVHVLDWRELARGPALRGLAEILATPPEVARERTDKRNLVEYNGRLYDTEGVSPTVPAFTSQGEVVRGSSITVLDLVEGAAGDTSTTGVIVAPAVAGPTRPFNVFTTFDLGATTATGDASSAGRRTAERSPVTVTPSVRETPTEGVTEAGASQPAISAGVSPTVGDSPRRSDAFATLGLDRIAEGATPSEVVTPSEGLLAPASTHIPGQAGANQPTISAGVSPTVGDSPRRSEAFAFATLGLDQTAGGVTPSEGIAVPSSAHTSDLAGASQPTTSAGISQPGDTLPRHRSANVSVDTSPTNGERTILSADQSGSGKTTHNPANLADSLPTQRQQQSSSVQREIYTPVGTGEIPAEGARRSPISPDASWVDGEGNRYESRRVQRVAIAQHSMALGEERVYQALWHAREHDGVFFEGKKTKTFSLGYDRIAKLVRLNEKSVRLLLPKLIAKRIIEVIASENSATRTGRTYRIFSYEEILERQRAANLLYVVKNGRAVEFVQAGASPLARGTPTVGETEDHRNSLDYPGESPTVGSSAKPTKPTVVATSTVSVGQTPSQPVGHSSKTSVGVTTTPLDIIPVKQQSQTTSSSVRKALASYGLPDDDAVHHMITQCKKNAPDVEYEEIAHFIHEKGQIIRNGRISNPIGFLLVYVPKCFLGEGLREFREERRRAREAEEVRRRELDEWRTAALQTQQEILNDPNSSEEDKRWARKFLEESPSS